jgi:hypothetical protein
MLLLLLLLWLSPQELLTMPKRDANLRAEVLLRRWKFPNTYTMVRLLRHILLHALNVSSLCLSF